MAYLASSMSEETQSGERRRCHPDICTKKLNFLRAYGSQVPWNTHTSFFFCGGVDQDKGAPTYPNLLSRGRRMDGTVLCVSRSHHHNHADSHIHLKKDRFPQVDVKKKRRRRKGDKSLSFLPDLRLPYLAISKKNDTRQKAFFSLNSHSQNEETTVRYRQVLANEEVGRHHDGAIFFWVEDSNNSSLLRIMQSRAPPSLFTPFFHLARERSSRNSHLPRSLKMATRG